MKIFIKGKGNVTLNRNNYLASGGQADIYVNGATAYKIYNNKSFMIPLGKISELASLTFKNIIKPEDIILDQNNNTLGYTMNYVKDTYTLCQLFPKIFRDRNSLSNQLVLDLIRRLQETVSHCHKNNVLIVDMNEMNFLVAKDFKEIFAIDCDSYKTPHYPATAIMDSIKDPQVKSNNFTEYSDWFSFGILAFQLFSTIHPFKGNHPIYKSMDERMDHNVSVFNKDVKVPRVCLDFNNIIPEAYKLWFKSIFDEGKRLPPPAELQITTAINTVIKTLSGSNLFNVKELEDYINTVVDLIWSPIKAVLNSDGLYINKILTKNIPTNANIALLPKSNAVVAGWIKGGKLELINATQRTSLKYDIEIEDIFSYDNRLYLKSNTSILELNFNEVGNNIITTSKLVAQVLEHSSLIFDGCVIQSLLGATFVSVFPNSGEHYQINLKELDKLKIIDAKFSKNVLMVLCNDNGKYNKYIFRFDDSFNSYDLRTLNDIQYHSINFIVLDSGTVVHILGDEKLEMFSNKKDSKTIKEIVDPIIDGDMKLFKDNSGLLFSRDGKVFSMKMK